ncbi:YebC-like protein [Cristinia sonorae]|uniref:YebC-like protein n=1 Tax=Cristinia sonorae TaxID=1940300 RepID=A0A8K0UYQ9_9AGAR|nr:YebC-like protein [Cristinia sonorae]
MLSLRQATRPILSPRVSLRCAFTTSSTVWSGHNKWSKIRHNKGAQDAKKSAINGKAHRDIMVAVRGGSGADPETNATLAVVLKRVRAQGVPKQTIESALKKAVGDAGKSGQYMTFEAMVEGTVGVMVECLTDNLNRTLHSLRDTIASRGARPAPVAFMFERKGCVRVALQKGEDFDLRLERLIDTALEAEAEDFDQTDSENSLNTVEVEFISPPTALARVMAAVTAPDMCKELLSSELIYRPTENSGVTPEEESLVAVSKLVEQLEANEDVLRVWTTLD